MEKIVTQNICDVVYCKRCHRRLKDNESKILGYGKTCYKKVNHQKKNILIEVPNEII